MKILNETELAVIEKNLDVFTKDCDLRKVYAACSSGCYVCNILLATAYVCGYPFFIRYYTMKNGKFKVDLTCDTPYGEYLIATNGIDEFRSKSKGVNEAMATEGIKDYFNDLPSVDIEEILKGATYINERGRYLRDSL